MVPISFVEWRQVFEPGWTYDDRWQKDSGESWGWITLDGQEQESWYGRLIGRDLIGSDVVRLVILTF